MDNAGKENIKVAIIAPYSIYPTDSGGKKYVALFYKYLRQILPVQVFTTNLNAEDSNVHAVLGTSRLRYGNIFLYWRIKKKIQKEKVTHLILEHPYFGWLGWLLKKNIGITLIIQSHNIEAIRFKTLGKPWWRLLQWYECWVHCMADINFYITEEDRQYAIEKYQLDSSKCHCITYGIEESLAPTAQEKLDAKKWLQEKYQLKENEKIILFVGSLGYAPNTEAVEFICEKINPILLAVKEFDYRILICGAGLPSTLVRLKDSKNIVFTGFVEDINVYFKGADIFINPIISGGGIKTKLVEALGNEMISISTVNGAVGVNENITNNKLLVVSDGNWEDFAAKIVAAQSQSLIGKEFFEKFYWGKIVEKAKSIILTHTTNA